MPQSLDSAWFVYDKEVVKGPFSGAQLREAVTQHQFSPAAWVWRKGHTAWQKLESLNLGLPPKNTDVWYLQSGGFHSGPYRGTEILEKVSSREVTGQAMAWTPELRRWTSIYEIPFIVDRLGICRRKHPRAPLVGTVHMAGVEQETNIHAMSISQGGIGIRFLVQPQMGVEYSIYLDSPLLAGNFYARGRVVYTFENETGIEFTHVSKENRRAIGEYLMQFGPEFV
jgi:hypothetical protein